MRKSSRLSLNAERRRLESLWQQHIADLEDWRRSIRPRLLRLFAERAATIAWSPALLNVLLDELHTDELFSRLVGSPRHLRVHQYPQAVAVAIALRHSWRPDDLARLATRLRIVLTPSTPEQRQRLTAGSISSTRTSKPGHHGRDSRARRRAVKALRSAPTPFGASGLDSHGERAKGRQLRDAPADYPRSSRRSRS
jgi:hypothetical protein